MADSVRLTELVAGCARRGAPLAAETGLFIALQSVEAVRSAPVAVTAEAVRVTAEGTVEVQGSPATTEAGAILGVANVLEAAVNPLPGGARDALRRARSGEVNSLGDLHAEIEALLVPLNRGAARRVLGRLVRDQQKDKERGAAEGAAGAGDEVDAGAMLARDALKAEAESEGEAVPPLPPPPRLGSLASLQATLPSALDTEQDAKPLGALSSAIDTEPGADQKKGAKKSKVPPANATDTIPDQPEGAGDDGDEGELDEQSEKRATKTPGRSGWFSSVLLWFIGLLVGGAVLFLAMRILGK